MHTSHEELASIVKDFWNHDIASPTVASPTVASPTVASPTVARGNNQAPEGATTNNTGTPKQTNILAGNPSNLLAGYRVDADMENVANLCVYLQGRPEGLFSLVNYKKVYDLYGQALVVYSTKHLVKKLTEKRRQLANSTPFDAQTGTPFDAQTGTPFDAQTGTPFDAQTGTPFDAQTGTPPGLTNQGLTDLRAPINQNPYDVLERMGSVDKWQELLAKSQEKRKAEEILARYLEQDNAAPGGPAFEFGAVETLLDDIGEDEVNEVYEDVTMDCTGDPNASAFTPISTGTGRATLKETSMEIWERLPWEDEELFELFKAYRGPGAQAGAQAAWRPYSRSLTEFAKGVTTTQGKMLNLKSLHTIANLLSWGARLQAFDNYQKKISVETKREEQRQLREDHLRMSKELGNAAHQRLMERLEDGAEDMKGTELLAILEKSIRFGRLSAGMLEDKPNAVELGVSSALELSETTPEIASVVTSAGAGSGGLLAGAPGQTNTPGLGGLLTGAPGQAGAQTNVTNNNLNITLETQKKLKDDSNLNSVLYILQESGALPKGD